MESAANFNRMGNAALRDGDARAAIRLFGQACALDPGQPALLFNLAAARRAAGDLNGAIEALDEALAVDPYFVQAMFQKAVVLDESGHERAAIGVFRNFLDTVPDELSADPRFEATLARARAAVAEDGVKLAAQLDAIMATASRRVRDSLAHLSGAAPLYRSESSFLPIAELPSIPFFDRAVTPWLDRLEKGWRALRDEALVLIDSIDRFDPYVANPPGTPLNQWAGLDHNRDWGAHFLWRHGTRFDKNLARLPAMTALLEDLPLLHLPGRAPNAFLSRLAPRTTIPAHNGVTNARATVHLPLIVPAGCGFRVGTERREWVPGEAWVFDDTIEHEAWNTSDEPRIILIFDIWNPLIDNAERKALASALDAYDRHHQIVRTALDEF